MWGAGYEVERAPNAPWLPIIVRRGILCPPGELGMVELKTTEAVVFQIAYAIVNPVAAGLVCASS